MQLEDTPARWIDCEFNIDLLTTLLHDWLVQNLFIFISNALKQILFTLFMITSELLKCMLFYLKAK